jgi:hypothetical protein
MMKFRLTRLLMWMGAAAAATYYFDPELGERRRKDLRKRMDRMRKMGRKARLQAGLGRTPELERRPSKGIRSSLRVP